MRGVSILRRRPLADKSYIKASQKNCKQKIIEAVFDSMYALKEFALRKGQMP